MSETYKQQYEKVVVALTVAYEKLEKTGEALRAAIAMRDENWQKYTDAIDRINAANAEAGRFERERDEARELLLQTRSHLADFKTLWSRAIKERDEALAERDAERRRAEKDEVDLDGMVMAFKAADQRISELSAKLAAALARAERAERLHSKAIDVIRKESARWKSLRASLAWVTELTAQASCAFCSPTMTDVDRERMTAHAAECPAHPLHAALARAEAAEHELVSTRANLTNTVTGAAECLIRLHAIEAERDRYLEALRVVADWPCVLVDATGDYEARCPEDTGADPDDRCASCIARAALEVKP